ncbi:hypothetical protein CcaverHIS002_0605030 [Cutaneotrichosporon cavernicola]|uniref:Uncharacterized protein n=1 Tax=Cutaneotrichosporon cavernicola TaxID=279322 RepID=A0AA48L8U5_9TREE|nr:uncharacterized protein CcaverHIS019_0604470 [Cutaneotrichosporon cavernicola]BEI86216.1 hypothetical protein CcaverHIS002_0605030 [Cutaneotrichosporon cavernicola]BEI93988.1 hypothetical protein CcaverHIS019_0604470 [Cutaneotrichosporon cavernicola]BEJ01769.1 hypothetical protein CcaverHIS631_0604510 [Cutaneotrichosporon cavernicola]BEJ09536.1 hypothetical protein CcaverHIS641_0604510 [Cutaneotrichosporon cavernicola]
MRALTAARTSLCPRPQCHLPCWPACREASSSAISAVDLTFSESPRRTFSVFRPAQDEGYTHSHPQDHQHQRARTRKRRPPATITPDPPPIPPLPPQPRNLDAALNALPPAFLAHPPNTGPHGLSTLLRLPASTSALARLLPAITSPVEPSATGYNQRLRALGWYAQAVLRAHALTYIRPVVDEALDVLAAATQLDIKNGADAVERGIARYHRFLRALAGTNPATDLPAAVQDEMARVVSSLVSVLEGMTPPATLAARPASFNALLSTRLLAPTTIGPILAHAKRWKLELSSSQWLAVATVGLQAGRHEGALRALSHAAGSDSTARHRLMAAEGVASLVEAVKLLEPFVAGLLVDTAAGETGAGRKAVDSAIADPTTSTRAWSILLSRVAADDCVTAKQLSTLVSQVPDAMAVSHTLTPVMRGLVQRGDIVAARRIWRDVQNSYQAAGEGRAALIDAAALSVGAEVQFTRPNGLTHALKAVDYYAWRPRRGHRVESPRPAGGRAVRLDTQALNVLISLASRAGQPGVAFRLWEAGLPRWDVVHDDISLTLILECALMCTERGFDPGMDSFRGRLRALASALHSTPTTYQSKEVDWRSAPITALLDPPRYSWHEEHGGQQPWARARALFRTVVLGNWPGLADVPSPLGARSFMGLVDLISPRAFPAASTCPPPASGANYAHIIPSARTWEVYMSLLRQYGVEFGDEAAVVDEVARGLGWMRALGTKPTWRTTLEALMHVGEHEGARRRVRIHGRTVLARDEEILRAWLGEWLPAVPSESDVANFRRKISSQ